MALSSMIPSNEFLLRPPSPVSPDMDENSCEPADLSKPSKMELDPEPEAEDVTCIPEIHHMDLKQEVDEDTSEENDTIGIYLYCFCFNQWRYEDCEDTYYN